MKVLHINSFGNLSTGRIATDLCSTLIANGHDGIIAYARNSICNQNIPYIKIGSKANIYVDCVMTRLTDRTGFYSKVATKKLVKDIDKYNPDIIHLHNLHGYYVNIEILFEYLRKCGKPIVWTLHDCWAFTGHCCYFSMVNCDKWKIGCSKCPQKKSYPSSYIDRSEDNYKKKKKLFMSLPNLTLVPVSQWLESEVKQSFLRDLPTQVIYNGINMDIFKPSKSDFRRKYRLENKYIILGVASTWDVRKGLSDFVKLSKMLDNDYQIVLVGITEKEKKMLPPNVIGINRTESLEELAGIYTTADIFFNASVEETFGLPTVEAMACGTPVIVYNTTALPEVVEKNSGFVVEKNDLENVKEIICSRPCKLDNPIKYYNKLKSYTNYMTLYKKLSESEE